MMSPFDRLLHIAVALILLSPALFAFEGRIDLSITRGDETTSLLYTVSESIVRIEMSGDSSASPINLIERRTGAVTVLYPHNRSFIRLSPSAAGGASPRPVKPNEQSTTSPTPVASVLPPTRIPSSVPRPTIGVPTRAGVVLPAVPDEALSSLPDAAPVPTPPSISYTPPQPPFPSGNVPSAAGRLHAPGMPPIPVAPIMSDKLELKSTRKKEKIFGYMCEKFVIKQPGQTMEIWATEQLFPYHPFLLSQQPLFGPRTIEEQWPRLLAAKKLFPLRASLRAETRPKQSATPERLRLEVKSITPRKMGLDDAELFQVPLDYTEIEPAPF